MDIVAAFEKHGRIDELARVFGFLFESPLNGGRIRRDCLVFPMDVIDELNERGIGYSFTLTNLTVAREFFDDPHTNKILARFERPINGVIVAHNAVADFIRKQYPGYRLRASCIYDYTEADEINRACERFDEVCVFPEVSDRPEVLAAITNKAQVVLFGTSVCLNRCGKSRCQHYYMMGQDHIAYYNHMTYKTPYREKDFARPHMPWCQAKLTTPMVHDMAALHALGFTTFKITQFDLFEQAVFCGEDVRHAKRPADLARRARRRRARRIGALTGGDP